MSQTTSSAMSEGPHLCLKNMLSKTEIVQFKALAANKLPIRRIFELTGFVVPSSNAICRNRVSGSDHDSFSVSVSRGDCSTRPSGNTVDVTKPHRAITCRLTFARKPSWATTRPSKSTCSLPHSFLQTDFCQGLPCEKSNRMA